jgi:hypothetical protein
MRAAGRTDLTHGWLRRPSGPAVRLAGSVGLLALAALGCAARGVTHLSRAGTLAADSGSVPFIVGVIEGRQHLLAVVGLPLVAADPDPVAPDVQAVGDAGEILPEPGGLGREGGEGVRAHVPGQELPQAQQATRAVNSSASARSPPPFVP